MNSSKPINGRVQNGFLIRLFTVAVLLAGFWQAGAAAQTFQSDNSLIRVSGPITSLPETRGWIGEWVIGRTKVKVTESTKIDQSGGKVMVGALVEIKGTKADGVVVAREIVVTLNPPTGAPVRFTGKIEELPSAPGRIGVWAISGRKVHVGSDTRIDESKGRVAVGALVVVEGLGQNDGSIKALRIEVLPDATAGVPVKFTGKVERLPDTRGRIGDWVVSGRIVTVTERTVIKQEHGEVMIGSIVEVEGLLQRNDTILASSQGFSVLASKIEVKRNVDPPVVRVHFRGRIESLPDNNRLIGSWKVSGREVVVTADTKLREEGARFAVGVLVEVKGILSNGVVKALIIIAHCDPPSPGYIKFIGVVRGLPGNNTLIGDWQVGGRVVHVFAETEIDQEKGRVRIGALVEVEGRLLRDRTVNAKRIEVKADQGETAHYIRFYGPIQSLPSNDLTGTWRVGGRAVHVHHRTRIIREHGRVEVGAFIEVEGNQRNDGSIDAYRIEVERDANAPDGAIGYINFYGVIHSLPDDPNFIGPWRVSDKKVVVTDMTKIDQSRAKVEVNAFIEVYGYLMNDDSVTAIKIKVKPVTPATDPARPRSYIEFIGTVESLPENGNLVGEWVVDGRTVNVYRRTRVHRGHAQVKVGATVEIIGAELPNDEIDAREIEVEFGPEGSTFVEYAPLTSVNAGSYQLTNSSSSIIASFGDNLAATTEVASSLPLPTTLGGASVLVDGRPAGLFFVSPNQINYQVPDDLQPGTAMVTVQRDGVTVAQGELEVGSVAPSLFTADASGQGSPAGLLLRVRADGRQSFEPLARFDASTNRLVPVSISRGAGERLYLVLYGTGLRNSEDGDGNDANGIAEHVQAFVGETRASVIYAGAAPGFAGLDQINIELPEGAVGASLDLLIRIDDGEGDIMRANTVRISIQ